MNNIDPNDKRHTWRRIFFIVLFACIYSVAEVVVAAVILLQVFFHVFTGNSNEHLLRFGKDLSVYIYQVFLYMTYNTDDIPFPFENWTDTINRPRSSNAE